MLQDDLLDTNQVDLPHHAAGRQGNPPIPPAAALALPDAVQRLHAAILPLVPRVVGKCLLQGVASRACGKEVQADDICPRLQERLDVKAVAFELVVHSCHSFPVDEDGGNSVHGVAIKHDGMRLQHILRDGECAFVCPWHICNPLDDLLVVAVVGVGDASGLQQCGAVVSGYLCRDGLHFGSLAQLPGSAKIDDGMFHDV